MNEAGFILISQAASQAILQLVQGGSLVDTALCALRAELKNLTPEQKRMLLELAATTAAAADGTSKELPTTQPLEVTSEGVEIVLSDRREGFEPQKALLFLVAPTTGTLRDELRELLGEKGSRRLLGQLVDSGVNLDLPLAKPRHVALFLESNNKPSDRGAATFLRTPQEEDIKAAGFRSASHHEGLVLCARLLNKADAESHALSRAETELLDKLLRGAVRTARGTLVIDGDGYLCDLGKFHEGFPVHFALGSRRLTK